MDSKWKTRFMNLSFFVAEWSKDPSRKVGAVVVNKDRHVLSTGYNGLPSFVNDSVIDTLTKDEKGLMCIHAEMNTLQHLPKEYLTGENQEPLYLFTSCVPCLVCSNYIVNCNANIKHVVYSYDGSETFVVRHKIKESLEKLKNNNISVEKVNQTS